MDSENGKDLDINLDKHFESSKKPEWLVSVPVSEQNERLVHFNETFVSFIDSISEVKEGKGDVSWEAVALKLYGLAGMAQQLLFGGNFFSNTEFIEECDKNFNKLEASYVLLMREVPLEIIKYDFIITSPTYSVKQQMNSISQLHSGKASKKTKHDLIIKYNLSLPVQAVFLATNFIEREVYIKELVIGLLIASIIDPAYLSSEGISTAINTVFTFFVTQGYKVVSRDTKRSFELLRPFRAKVDVD